MRSFVLALLVLLPFSARAEEPICDEVHERGYEGCYRQNDAARTACVEHCARCGQEEVGCFSYCEHFCDASYPEGCAFDLNACISRCGHRCHEPACEQNPGCLKTWCGKDTVKTCADTCRATWDSLKGCRGSWCADGKARATCLSGCSAGRAPADACRKSWCGDGKAAQKCYRDADEAEEQCRAQVDTTVKACQSGGKK